MEIDYGWGAREGLISNSGLGVLALASFGCQLLSPPGGLIRMLDFVAVYRRNNPCFVASDAHAAAAHVQSRLS
jgi:hypothetical protein